MMSRWQVSVGATPEFVSVAKACWLEAYIVVVIALLVLAAPAASSRCDIC